MHANQLTVSVIMMFLKISLTNITSRLRFGMNTYLRGADPGSKLTKAEKLGVKIMQEQAFYAWLDKQGG